VAGLWIKTVDGWKQSEKFSAKTVNGWWSGKYLYLKTGATTWSQIVAPDTTPPSAPSLISISHKPNTREMTVVIRMPTDPDVMASILKYSSVAAPTNPLDESDYFDWSIKPAEPNQLVTYTFEVPKTATKYYFSAWAVDTSKNVSQRMRIDYTVPTPVVAPPPKAPVIKKLTQNALDSGTWGLASDIWSPNMGKNVAQAGPYSYRGAWIYGGIIEGALKNAKKIRRATIRIQRLNTNHGPQYNAFVWLTMHRLGHRGAGGSATPALSPVRNPPVRVGSLARGQVKTFDIPAAWFPLLMQGGWKGFGLWYPHSQATGADDVNYIQCYGAGTTSGQVYIEWEE
jgi:hypothetical protein